MFTVRKQIYATAHEQAARKVSTDLDQHVVAGQELAPGKSCRIEYRGSGWTALNVGEQRSRRARSAHRLDRRPHAHVRAP